MNVFTLLTVVVLLGLCVLGGSFLCLFSVFASTSAEGPLHRERREASRL